LPLAHVWRLLLFRTTIIAVCGSVGKTTTKELLAAILSEKFLLEKTNGTWGGFKFGGVAGTILSVRPWHQFAIVEVGIESKGEMEKMAKLLRPHMVVMLSVKECHLMEFNNLENIAAEKQGMLKVLRENDIAVLNSDDPLVSAMADTGPFRTVTFGQSSKHLSVVESTSKWPQCLTIKVEENEPCDSGRSPSSKIHTIQSQLLGTHWVTSILAALTASVEYGISIEQATRTIEKFEPFWARMQPITLDNGVTYLRDEWNGSYDTFIEAFNTLKDADAARKIVVISEYSDSHNSSKPRQKIKRLAQEIAPFVNIAIFVGDRAEYGMQAAIAAGLESEHSFAAKTTHDAAALLKAIQLKGDLVLIKGRSSHHLSRIYLAQLNNVTCNVNLCSRQYLCDRCQQLGFEWQPKYKSQMAPKQIIV